MRMSLMQSVYVDISTPMVNLILSWMSGKDLTFEEAVYALIEKGLKNS